MVFFVFFSIRSFLGKLDSILLILPIISLTMTPHVFYVVFKYFTRIINPLRLPSIECHLLIAFYLNIFQILLRHHLGAYMSNLELCFSIFHLLFADITIQWHHNFLTNLV